MKRSLPPKELYELGKKYAMTGTICNDLIIRHGAGSSVFGVLAESNHAGPFLDFSSQVGCHALGHAHPAIVKVIKNQFKTGLLHSCGLDWFNESEIFLMEELCHITPDNPENKKVFLCNSGTEAVEAAIKFCNGRRYNNNIRGRERFLAFQGAFHGRTLGSLSLNCSKAVHTAGFFNREDNGDLSTGNRIKRRAIPVSHIPFPHRYDEKSQYDFKAFLDLLFLNDVNAIFIELIQGEGGIRVVDQYCLNLLLEKCRKNDVYIVVDEVQTGLMRTGKMFACNHYDLEPDIICLGKALSGGAIPIAATVAKKEFDLKPGQHSNTFGGGPLACEVALALIDELKKLDPFSLDEKGRILENFAPEGLGFMRRVVLESKEKRDDVVDKALHKGLLLLGAGEKSIRLMPPLNISVENLERGLNILKECM